MIRKGRTIVVSKETMIRISVIEARVLTRKGKTTGVTSWLAVVEVLLRNVVIEFVILVVKMIEIVLRNCAHVIGSVSRRGANVEDVFDNDAA